MKAFRLSIFVFLLSAGLAPADKISGKVSALSRKKETFKISGVKVDVKGQTLEEGSLTTADLKWRMKVEVEGTFTGPGTFSASKIVKREGFRDTVEGTIVDMDREGRQIVIGWVTVSVPGKMDPGGASAIEDRNGIPAPFARLADGMKVECEGFWSGVMFFTADKVRIQ